MARTRRLSYCYLTLILPTLTVVAFGPEPVLFPHRSSSSSSLTAKFSALHVTSDTINDEDGSEYAPSSLSTNSLESCSTMVNEAMEDLYPSKLLDQRIATSRKDGYWPFIREGQDPPSEFVYGEFDLNFFFQVLQTAAKELLVFRSGDATDSAWRSSMFHDWVFTDLGSGTGRLVLAAGGLYPLKLCRGIELLPGLHEQALQKLELCSADDGDSSLGRKAYYDEKNGNSRSSSRNWEIRDEMFAPTESGLWLAGETTGGTISCQEQKEESAKSDNMEEDHGNSASTLGTYSLRHRSTQSRIPLAPIEFHCGSFTDPYQYFGDSNILFCFSSCLPPSTRLDLARAIGRQCQKGTIVITTEYALAGKGTIEPSPDDPSLPHGRYELELLETITGENESTGGLSTVYIHRLNESVGDGLVRHPPELSIHEKCYRAVKSVEDSNDPRVFVRKVANEMIFAGFPVSWIPHCQ